jgi:hypothetical protein
MKLKPMTIALACAGLVSTPVLADEMSELKAQLNAMQQQMQIMQAKLEAQETALKQQQAKQQDVTEALQHQQAPGRPGTIPGDTGSLEDVAHNIGNSITIGGAVEVNTRGTNSSKWDGESASDIILDTFELGIGAQAGDWVSGNILFLYEQDPGPGREGDELLVDEAYITIANPEVTPFFGTAGRIYVPFGNFESYMITDPITLTLGETRAEVLQVGVEMENGLYGSAYIYNGDILQEKHNYTSRENSHINNFGLNVGYAMERDNFSLDVGAGYLNNIATSDGLTDAVDGANGLCDGDPCVADYVGGVSACDSQYG